MNHRKENLKNAGSTKNRQMSLFGSLTGQQDGEMSQAQNTDRIKSKLYPGNFNS